MTTKQLRSLLVIATLLATLTTVGFGQIIGQNPDFDATAAEEEAYWYSRYNLGHLTMRAGMGEAFMPDPEMVSMMIAIADADPLDGDTVHPPVNPALLRTVYASGDPLWVESADPSDFATLRWDPNSFDTRITGSALGWTIIKEVEWAKQFHIDSHFGIPTDDFGAQWRFTGLALIAMAKMQAMAWIDLHEAGEMVMVDKSDAFVMLMAFADLADVLGARALPHSETNRYRDLKTSAMIRTIADEQYDRVLAIPTESMSVKELSTAIQGLVWFASVTTDSKRHADAKQQIGHLEELLLARPTISATDKGYALRGVIEVYRVLDSLDSLHASRDLVEELASDFDSDHGIFRSQLVYTIDDVAAIVGGLNAVKLYGDIGVALLEDLFTGFFEGVVNLSGVQRSVPPIESSKGQFELGAPDIYYSYPSIPLPGAVGEYGVAPVFASSVTFDTNSNTWTVSDERFDTAGAMHASNEFIWLHADEVNGFPDVGDHASVAPAMPAEAEVEKDVFVNRLLLHLVLLALTVAAVYFIKGE